MQVETMTIYRFENKFSSFNLVTEYIAPESLVPSKVNY